MADNGEPAKNRRVKLLKQQPITDDMLDIVAHLHHRDYRRSISDNRDGAGPQTRLSSWMPLKFRCLNWRAWRPMFSPCKLNLQRVDATEGQFGTVTG